MVLIGCLIVSKTVLVISLEVGEETRTVLQKSKKYLLQFSHLSFLEVCFQGPGTPSQVSCFAVLKLLKQIFAKI